MRAQRSISAVFQFNQVGEVKRVYLNAENDLDQKVLEKGLQKLIKPWWFQKFLKRLRHGVR